jgi:hypothetical protein
MANFQLVRQRCEEVEEKIASVTGSHLLRRMIMEIFGNSAIRNRWAL